ncbi:MAG: hypothetical protein IT535_13125 [Bauldia sp.]|nr:hypothetical protein [Bauldia sp.]
MAENERITLVIEGLPEDEGQVRFNAFLAELQRLSATVSKLDKDANDGTPGNSFRIAALSYASPIRVTLEAHAVRGKPPSGHLIIASLHRVAEAITTGDDLLDVDAELLDDIGSLAKPVGKQIKNATLLFDDVALDLTPEVAQRVERALAVADECYGTVEGMLDQINVHAGANLFHIYPEVGPRKVACRFPNSLLDDAVSAVGRRVEVSGTLHFRAKAVFPHQIAVAGIDPFPPESELPDWDDLRGLAPDATGGVPSEVFIRRLRENGWR